jgi:hypothetical protein
MGNRARLLSLGSRLALEIALTIVLVVALAGVPALSQQTTFTARDASRLLMQINDGLVNRNASRFLAPFDLNKMSGGLLFKQQITSLLAHTDGIRTHFNLDQVTVNAGQGEATVDAEMEADTRNGAGPPLHKQATLHFVAEPTASGWKFIDLQPRSFFSTSSGSR